MNKIERMLQELCPEGVEYKKLGEIGTFTRGSGLQKKDFTENGIGCIHYGQIYTYYGTSTTETKSFVHAELAKSLTRVKPGDIIIACTSENVEDVCKAVAWLGTTEIVTGGHACVFSHKENPKYISYFFQTENFFQQKKKFARGVKVIDVKAIDLAKIEIPLPPIKIQEEIVRILDHFTELTASLQAELQARQEQYEYYRNRLLMFDAESVSWMKMSEIAEIGTGNSNRQDAIADGAYPFFVRSKNVFHSGTYEFNEEAVIIPGEGGIGDIFHYVKGKYALHQRVYRIHLLDNKVNTRFLYYYMWSHFKNFIMRKAVNATVTSIRKPMIEKFEIPIIPLTEQQRIVSILDKFEALVNDLLQGLPAEIAAVQEQYEYYRNKLLTFNHIKSN